MTDKPENPLAFPTEMPIFMLQEGSDAPAEMIPGSKFIQGGMTLRDYFAAAALQGMNANPELFEVVTTTSVLNGDYFDKAAKNAYKQADSMLKARQS